MSIKQKQFVLFWILMVLTVWPLVHHVLVVRYDLDKWSFMGFSMYISKRPIHTNMDLQLDWINVNVKEDRMIHNALLRFTKERTVYGRWYDPSRLAREVFAASNQIDEFSLSFDVLWMDRATAIFTGDHIRYSARRPGPGEPFTFIQTRKPILDAAARPVR